MDHFPVNFEKCHDYYSHQRKKASLFVFRMNGRRKGDLLLLLWTYMQQNKRVWYFNRISLGNYVFRHFKDSVLNKLNKVHHLTTRKVLKNQQKYEKRKYLLVFLLFWFLDKNLIVSFKNQKGYLSTNKKCNGSRNFFEKAWQKFTVTDHSDP